MIHSGENGMSLCFFFGGVFFFFFPGCVQVFMCTIQCACLCNRESLKEIMVKGRREELRMLGSSLALVGTYINNNNNKKRVNA